MSTRRSFLTQSLGAVGIAACGVTVPRFLARTAAAAADEAARKGETLLVVVQLTGGNDGLNTVVPYGDDGYGRLRKALRLKTGELKKIDDYHGLHPALSGFHQLLQQGALAIVQGVGYPNPSESHFRSMDIWQAGSLAEDANEGWLGKSLARLHGTGAFHVAGSNEVSSLLLAGAPAKVPTLSNLDQFQLQQVAANQADRTAQRRMIEEMSVSRGALADSPQGRDRLLDFVCRTAVNTYASSRKLRESAKSYTPQTPYPASPLANRLKLVAQLIDAEVGARIFYVTQDGYDTHANQLGAHASLLSDLSAAVTAFYQDLSARGHADRLLLLTFSEFGRRAKENDSGGTDHGSAEPLFVIGGQVRPGLHGKHPSLADLHQDKLKHHTDFRQVYATLLEQWLNIRSAEVLGEKFVPVEFLKPRGVT